MLLDQVALQHECLQFGIGDDILKSPDALHHLQNLRALAAAALKVLAHAVFQADRLSDVDDVIMRVMHNVNTGAARQLFQFFFYIKSRIAGRCLARLVLMRLFFFHELQIPFCR